MGKRARKGQGVADITSFPQSKLEQKLHKYMNSGTPSEGTPSEGMKPTNVFSPYIPTFKPSGERPDVNKGAFYKWDHPARDPTADPTADVGQLSQSAKDIKYPPQEPPKNPEFDESPRKHDPNFRPPQPQQPQTPPQVSVAKEAAKDVAKPALDGMLGKAGLDGMMGKAGGGVMGGLIKGDLGGVAGGAIGTALGGPLGGAVGSVIGSGIQHAAGDILTSGKPTSPGTLETYRPDQGGSQGAYPTQNGNDVKDNVGIITNVIKMINKNISQMANQGIKESMKKMQV